MPLPLSHQIHPLPHPPPSPMKNYKWSNVAKLTGSATLDKPLYPQITLILMKCVSISTIWDTSRSIANFTLVPPVSTMPQTTSKTIAHSVVTTIQLVLYPLYPTNPLLPQDQFAQCPLLWQTDFPLSLFDGLSVDLVTPIPPLHIFTTPLSDSVVFILPPWVLTTTMSLTLTPEGTSMVIRVFQQCLNATMGVMLWLPVSSFILFVHLCFPLVSLLIDCLNPVVYVSFTLFYSHDFWSIRSFLEYSL